MTTTELPTTLAPVRFALAGRDGNALSLIGAWRRAARTHGWPEAVIDAVSTEAMAGDYAHVLTTLLAHSRDPDDGDDE